MNDMSPEDHNKLGQEQVGIYDPPIWITTDQLETELFNAIMEDSGGVTDDEEGDFDEIDAHFDNQDDEEDEAEHRRSTLRLLALMRPQLAALLGGPTAEQCS
jgi:hypothetical protein